MLDKKIIDGLTNHCGVYLLLRKNIPIYIGKAINIRARLKSHLLSAKLNRKEKIIITKADSVKVIKTNNEFEALVKEAELINNHKPAYNVRWRDDKSYLYIKLNFSDSYPKPFLCRKENDHAYRYFGPFSSKNEADFILRSIRRIIPFCQDKKINKKKCFYSHIGLCDPCPNEIEKKQIKKLKLKYKNNLKKIRAILEGKSMLVKKYFNRAMLQAAKKKDYENALFYRKKLEKFDRLLTRANIFSQNYLHGQESSGRLNKEIQVFLKTYFNTDLRDKDKIRIECFDMSVLFAKYATASMVVFENGSLRKSQYRRYRISQKSCTSDIDMIEEVIQRRFATRKILPSLIVIDGGRPQISAVKKVLDSKKLNIPVVGIAKKPDRILFTLDKKIRFDRQSFVNLFHTITLLRDESHRVARSYHILLRQKDLMI